MESKMALSKELLQLIKTFQKNEITEYHIYQRLAKTPALAQNAEVLKKIADDELKHYHIWKQYTKESVTPHRFKIAFYYGISRLFGLTFGIKLMERGEEAAQASYQKLIPHVKEAETIRKDENEHEAKLIRLLDEELLRYISSIVLGLNDALVELTGALAGLTLALQNTNLIAITGSITGIAAALSMSASEYLSTKSEENTHKNPLRAAVYTGIAYILTVLLLILPYLIFSHYVVCLALALFLAVVVIAFFNYYISVAKDLNFKRRFFEMAGLSLGIAALSFFIGWMFRTVFGITI
jgi:VIT1/CCC1 family predicted Fe2+/Mn2+ transporter